LGSSAALTSSYRSSTTSCTARSSRTSAGYR
jgi:hypothetical protein